RLRTTPTWVSPTAAILPHLNFLPKMEIGQLLCIACQSGELETIQSAGHEITGKKFPECWKNISEAVKPPGGWIVPCVWQSSASPVPAELQQCSRSCLGTQHRDVEGGTGSGTWPQALGWRSLLKSLLHPALPDTASALSVFNCCISGGMASVYEESVYSGSRRYSAPSSHAPSEYSCYLGSGSRASSRASSARASPVIEERPEKDFEKGARTVSSLSAATLASLGGTSSRRGSGDTSISADTEASIREIKDIYELKDQIQDVEGKYMQGLKELKDSLAEVEEKYKKAMVSNAQLDNEKTNFMYQVDTLKDALLELEEQLAESRRQYEEKSKEFEREKHAHSILQFQFMEIKEALKQREEMLAEIQQLQQKQQSYVREISDLQETIEWKDKKIGALERQKDFFDSIRSERDDLRDEVVVLKEQLKKHGIIPDSDIATNGETSDILDNEGHLDSSRTVPGTTQALKPGGEGMLALNSPFSLPDRLKKLIDERESLLDQIKKLKGQLEEKQRNGKMENTQSEDEVLENGTDMHMIDLQRDANRQISDLKFKLAKSEQEITALEQNVIRLEGQVARYKTAAENAERVEDELKAEKRKLQRELRSALDKTEELEVSNGHLVKRLEKMKANRSALLSQQ
ncbi:LRRF2 protein, partial [Pachycephala philippinensis]|nr:LRRF2 protein [Pachycephala philippinensis]